MVIRVYRECLLVVIVTTIMGLGAPNWAVAKICPEVSLVNPPSPDGGTIFVKPGDDGSYHRAGYLQTGMVLKVNDEMGIGPPEDEDGPKRPYLDFVSSTGLSGWVDKAATSTLTDLIDKLGEGSLDLYNDCDKIKAVVFPVDPLQDVEVYYRPEVANANSDTFRFSRSSYSLVVLRDYPPVVKEAKDGTKYFRVWSIQKESDPPRSVWKKGFLRKSNLDEPKKSKRSGRYRFGLLPDKFTPLSENLKCSNATSKCADFALDKFLEIGNNGSSFIGKIKEEFRKKLLVLKTCRGSAELSFDIKLNFWPLPFVEFEPSGKFTAVKLPEGERYGFRSFPNEGTVFYTQTCKDDDVPVGVKKISLDRDPTVSIYSSSVSNFTGGCFVLAEKLGANTGHANHMVVALNGGGANPSYYEAFTELDRYFRGVAIDDLGLDWEKQLLQDRFVAFLHHLLVGWQSNSKWMGTIFEKECGTR